MRQRANSQPVEDGERGGDLREQAVHRVVAELVARRRRDELRAREVRDAARRLGIGERSVWRYVAAGRVPERSRPSPRRLVLSDELRDAYLRLGANAAAVWREQHDAGLEPPPLRTLQAAFARDLSPAQRASAKRGEAGRREHSLYLRYEAPHRNAVWQADHKQLPLLVVAPGRERGRRPWVTLFLDDFSRAVMGWAISLQPTSAEVLAALRDAVHVDPHRGPFGRLRWDHGLEFAAGAVELAALALGIDVDPATPYAPHEKGKIERLNRTIAESFIATLPGYTNGPRDQRGRLEAGGTPLELAELVTRFAGWVDAYNTRRAHRALGGRTPLERLAFAPHDQRSVEVYRRGAWLCTAHPQNTLSRAEQQRILAERRAYAAELRRRQRRAQRRARSRLAPATAEEPQPAEVTRLPEDTRTSRRRAGPREEALRAAARTDLLLPRAGAPRARDRTE